MPASKPALIQAKAATKSHSPKVVAPNTATTADPLFAMLVQRALAAPGSLSPREALQLQPLVGNRAVSKVLQGAQSHPVVSQPAELPAPRQAVSRLPAASLQAPTIQRLALQFGDKPPIPGDATKIATAQDATRGAVLGVQGIDASGNIAVPPQAYKDMANRETVYLVAHGRPALGDQPAMLESGDGPTIDGSQVASIVNTIRSGLKNEKKSLGDFKIEACMSSLSRKTKGGMFGGIFVTEQPSLLDDTRKSLAKIYKVTDVNLRGNPGFSAGSEFEGGVENTTPAGTEIGLLDPLLAGIDKAKASDPPRVSRLVADALNIVDKQRAFLDAADKVKQLRDLHGQKSTADYLAQVFGNIATEEPDAVMIGGVLAILVSYAKSLAKK